MQGLRHCSGARWRQAPHWVHTMSQETAPADGAAPKPQAKPSGEPGGCANVLGVVLLIWVLDVYGRCVDASYAFLFQALGPFAFFVAIFVGGVWAAIAMAFTIVSVPLAVVGAVFFALLALHWVVWAAGIGFALLAWGAVAIAERLALPKTSARPAATTDVTSKPALWRQLGVDVATSVRDTAVACLAGVLLIVVVQSLVNLWSGFHGDSALVWASVASVLRQLVPYGSIPLPWLAVILGSMVLVTAVWRRIQLVSHAMRLLKWMQRTKIVLAVASTFTLTAAASGDAAAARYLLGVRAATPTPSTTSPAARAAAAAYVEWYLSALPPAKRDHLAHVWVDMSSHAAPKERIHVAADEFARAATFDAGRVAETPDPRPSPAAPPRVSPENDEVLYKQAREGARKVASSIAKSAWHSHGVRPSDRGYGAYLSNDVVQLFVDAAISSVATTIFDRVAPKSQPNLESLRAWASHLRSAPPSMEGVRASLDASELGLKWPRFGFISMVADWAEHAVVPRGTETEARSESDAIEIDENGKVRIREPRPRPPELPRPRPPEVRF